MVLSGPSILQMLLVTTHQEHVNMLKHVSACPLYWQTCHHYWELHLYLSYAVIGTLCISTSHSSQSPVETNAEPVLSFLVCQNLEGGARRLKFYFLVWPDDNSYGCWITSYLLQSTQRWMRPTSTVARLEKHTYRKWLIRFKEQHCNVTCIARVTIHKKGGEMDGYWKLQVKLNLSLRIDVTNPCHEHRVLSNNL